MQNHIRAKNACAYISILFIVSTFFLTEQVIAAGVKQQPNIIWIMPDDLGYGDLGCFGQEKIRTPNIDKLAKGGMKLTNFYAGCTVCRPSRLVLWTGLQAGHTAISSNVPYHFTPEVETVGERLQKAGYATGGVGKWAMGDNTNTGHPLENGFDFWMGYLNQSNAHNYYPPYLWLNRSKYPLAGNVLYEDKKTRGRVAKERVTYSHDVMTDQALDFIRRNQHHPFLLNVHWTIPHANNEGGGYTGNGMEVPDYGEYADKDWPDTAKGQAAMITRMDGDVGRIRDLLVELRIERETLLIFTSDNGPHSEGGHKHEYFNANGRLRGYKRDLYEGGIRVPTIAYWPGTVAPGTTCEVPFAFWDFMPTACELAGIEAPANTDGISFLPALANQPVVERPYLYWQYQGKQAVRAGNWKLVRTGKDKPWELYDLEADLGEETDLAADYQKVVQRLEGYAKEAQ
jgi:arylsulfatase A-like enzyme